MDDFLREVPALIITLAVLSMATVLIIVAHVNVSDALAIVSPAIAFWFLRGAFNSQPSAPTPAAPQPRQLPPTNTSQPPA